MIKKRLLRLLGRQRKYIVYQIIWQWISLWAEIGFVWLLAQVIQSAYSGGLTSEMLVRDTVFAGCTMLLRYICSRMEVRTGYAASSDVKRILRDRIYGKLLKLGPSYREQVSSAEIVSMTTDGVEQLETYFSKYLPQFFYALLAPVTLFLLLLRVSVKSAVILLIAVPLIPIVIMVVMKVARKLLDHYFKIYYGLADTFLEKLHGLTTLKIYQADKQAARDMADESEQFRRVTMKVLGMQLNSTAIMDIVAYGGTAAGFVTALAQYRAGAVSLTGMIMILFLGAEFFLPMRLLGSYFHIGMNGMKASDRIFAFLDLPEPPSGGEEMDPSDTGIVVDHVNFSYEKDRQILKDISVKIPSGAFVTIAGVSGSGKSTLAGILTGKNRTYTGTVSIGGKPLQELSTESRMRCITLVSHDSMLFSGSVRDNLLMGNPDASDEQMKEVLRKVALPEFAEDLSMHVAEQGSDLSGGQRQRLCFARALLHDSAVYIFDEAASSIDRESEEVIMKVIRSLAGKRTVIMITHRLAEAEGSDRIYLLDHGRVAEEGTHEELMRQGGIYASMFTEQKQLEDYTRTAKSDQPRTAVQMKRQDARRSAETEEEKKRRSAFAIMKKLIVLVKPLTGVMLTGIALGVIGYLCAIFLTVLAAQATGRITTGAGIAGISAVILIIAVARGFLHYGEQYCNHYIAFRLLALIRNRVFAALQKLCPAKLEGKEKGNLISVITSDIELLEVFYAHTISPTAIAVITSLILCIFTGRQFL
ncbi:MAG: ABC transporter transmembrane domain-containing protein, partial [Candidatus Weimeria sp.]